ncbi:hypothetical protein GT348_08630 [Aristophania vespae]|uniref:Uncharacterized protein n=1 Tax=Aristophania vespae TaxID=2697033 RepID=A0A6P1NIC7_9PROT|nr:hypothetical protein [Aristophania vespae]QHI96280.1 hypothetical protein GT348_08630 [Aristophania vespae]
MASQAKGSVVVTPTDKQTHELPEQWYTGSLFSPSPALPEAGMAAAEPYVSAGVPIGAYNSSGALKKNKAQTSISNYVLMKYAVTDHLSLYLLPTYSYSWGNHTKHSGVKFNDLPFELQYRFTPHYSPSFTVFLGFNAPVGSYTNLANASEGVGRGVWSIRYGVHSQLVYPFFSHAMRIRLWAVANQPVSSARLRNISSYGTEKGFAGRGHAGPTGNEGMSLEFGITKKWVIALDLYHNWAASNEIKGLYRQTKKHYYNRTGWSGLFNVGPALEYNWSPNMGAIAGVILPVAGHNASRTLQTQCAVFAMF